MISIPNDSGQFLTDGRSNTRGNLWSSFNLDLSSNQGRMRVSPRTIITTNGISNFGIPVAFQTFTDNNAGIQYVWTVSGVYMFRMTVASGLQTAFVQDAAAGTPSGSGTSTSCSSDTSDLVAYGSSYMVLSLRNTLYYYSASSGQWFNVAYDTDGSAGGPVLFSLVNGVAHNMCVYRNRVYVTDGDATGLTAKVYSVAAPFNTTADTNTIWAYTGSNSLDLTNRGYPVTVISTMRPVTDGIWVFTVNQQKNGCYAFKWDGTTATDPNSAYIIPDASGVLACVIKEDRPWIIDNNGRLMYFSGGSFVEAKNGRLPVKSYKFLKNPLSSQNDRWIHQNGMQIVDGKINVLVNNEYQDNTQTIEESIASGVWEYDADIGWYHKMSLSAYAGAVTDYGQNRLSRVGALYSVKTDSTDASSNGTMLMGAQYYSDATTTVNAAWIDDTADTIQKYGYFVTPWVDSSSAKDEWSGVYVRHRRFLDSADKVTVKYRQFESPTTGLLITWTSTSTFTTSSADVSGMVGYEVEVTRGTGSGKCAHILSVSGSGTYTVTLDDTFTGATGTARARVQSWTKVTDFTGQALELDSASLDIGTPARIQFKVCMQFTGQDELHKFYAINSESERII